MEKEKIVTPENSIYIDGLRLGRRLLFMQKNWQYMTSAENSTEL